METDYYRKVIKEYRKEKSSLKKNLLNYWDMIPHI